MESAKESMNEEEFDLWYEARNFVTFHEKFDYWNTQHERDTHVKDFFKLLKTTYFAMTSLSTVGFGDLRPESDMERLICAMILMLGVALFSLMMGSFIEIVNLQSKMNEEQDGGD